MNKENNNFDPEKLIQATRDEIVEMIKGMKYDSKTKHRSMFFHRTRWCPKCEDDGYNYALDDLLDKLQ